MKTLNKKYKQTYEMKEGYYKITDGIDKLRMEFENCEDNEAIKMMDKLDKLTDEIYNHIGGV